MTNQSNLFFRRHRSAATHVTEPHIRFCNSLVPSGISLNSSPITAIQNEGSQS